MKPRRLSAWACVVSGCLAGVVASRGQELAVSADHSNGVYSAGEPVRWSVVARSASGTVDAVRYTLKKGGMTELRTGTLALTNGTGVITETFAGPGTLLAEVTVPGATGALARALGGGVASPSGIALSAPRPDDFDAFWAGKLEELSRVPANPGLEPGISGLTNVNYWTITMDNIRGTRIRGQIARPVAGDKLPALLIVQWAGVYPLQKGWVTDRAREGWLALNINAHDLPIAETNTFYKEQSEGPLKDYPAIGNTNRETSYFLRMYLSCYRAADYLTTRPDWDGRTLVVTGGSQGGLQAVMVAGLHPKITAALASVPAGCDMLGPDVGRSPGWPMWYWKTEGKDTNAVRQASRYYDVANFASRVKCPLLVGLGLVDQTCPPAGVFAMLNQVPGPREIVILPKAGHQDVRGTHAAYYARLTAWLAALREGKPAPVRAADLP